MKHKSFIVPHDFTSVADNALHHAIETSKKVNTTIHILHVVENESEINAATDKIDAIIAQNSVEGITLTNNVRIGNIFTSIADFSAEHQAEMIFMGTHGAHGWQHVVGRTPYVWLQVHLHPLLSFKKRLPKQVDIRTSLFL